MRLHKSQLDLVEGGYLGVSGFNTSDSVSDNVTTALTTALVGAGRGGVNLPLQVSTNEETEGVKASGNNIVQIYDGATGAKLDDGAGNEIYGRITEAAGVYTLAYFSSVAGTETPYTFSVATSIDFEFIYRFRTENKPADFAVSVRSKRVSDDPANQQGNQKKEQLSITALNTVSNLSKTPTGRVSFLVNGKEEDDLTGGAFTVSGTSVTFNQANADYNLLTTFRVIAIYNAF